MQNEPTAPVNSPSRPATATKGTDCYNFRVPAAASRRRKTNPLLAPPIPQIPQIFPILRPFAIAPNLLHRLNEFIGAAQANTLDIPLPANQTEARATLKSMAKAALADGKITREEQSLLEAAGQHLGLSDKDVSLLLKRTRTELYEDAKEAMRFKPMRHR